MILPEDSILIQIFQPIADYAGVFLWAYIIYQFLDVIIGFFKFILNALDLWK